MWQEGEEPERREDESGGDSVWDSSHPAHEGAVRFALLLYTFIYIYIQIHTCIYIYINIYIYIYI
jgi:hypothetical protein